MANHVYNLQREMHRTQLIKIICFQESTF